LVSDIKGVYRLRLFEKLVLRRRYEPKTEEVTGQRKLHNKEREGV
jgi:hypothetical protein